MSEHSNIPWTDSTWNPWRGCTKVSAGCQNCYAERLVTTRMGGKWGKGAPRVRAAKATFEAPLRWNKKPFVCDDCGQTYPESMSKGTFEICHECFHEKDKSSLHGRSVFLGSLMDWLDPDVPVEWLADALDIIRRCPDLTFQCVTKRPELFYARMRQVVEHLRMTARFNSDLSFWACRWSNAHIERLSPECTPRNVHVLTSIEDQRSADERIPHLLKIPAVVRGLSVEPILERIDLGLSRINYRVMRDGPQCGEPYIGWGIVGGESGPNRREAKGGTVEAITDVVHQFQAAGVPPFVKQDCHRLPGQQGRLPDDVWDIKQFPAGRVEVAA